MRAKPQDVLSPKIDKPWKEKKKEKSQFAKQYYAGLGANGAISIVVFLYQTKVDNSIRRT